MKFTTIATLLVVASAANLDRDLGAQSKETTDAYATFTASKNGIAAKQGSYKEAKTAQLKEENDLQAKINAVEAKEKELNTAQATTKASLGAFEAASNNMKEKLTAYFAALSADALDYSKWA